MHVPESVGCFEFLVILASCRETLRGLDLPFQYITHVISRLLVFRLIMLASEVSEPAIERKLIDLPCQKS